jgi:hypothetical protein
MMDLFTERIEIGDKFYPLPCWSVKEKPYIYVIAKEFDDKFLIRGMDNNGVLFVMKDHLKELYEKIL